MCCKGRAAAEPVLYTTHACYGLRNVWQSAFEIANARRHGVRDEVLDEAALPAQGPTLSAQI